MRNLLKVTKFIPFLFLLAIIVIPSQKVNAACRALFLNQEYLDKVYSQQTEELTEAGVITPTPTSEPEPEPEVPEKKFKYVAIGNSVTIHETNDLWHGDWGMAATSKEADYVHVLAERIGEAKFTPVDLSVISCKNWELGDDRRGELLHAFDNIPQDTDLITIQTGENITTFIENLDGDYDALFGYIRSKAPNAQILVLGEVLWPQDAIETAKRNNCGKYNIGFVDMNEFLNGYETMYRSSMGEPIVGIDGNTYLIDNECVAAHPNDAGMQKITDIVFASIK